MSLLNISFGTDHQMSWIAEALTWAKVAAPALISAFLSGYLISRYKSREDNLDRRCDELCNEIDKITTLAQSYWTKSALELRGESGQFPDVAIKVKIQRIAGLRVMIEQFMSPSAANELVSAEQILMRGVTGGNFGVHNRVSDFDRAKLVQYEAAKFVLAIRDARMKDVRGWRRRK